MIGGDFNMVLCTHEQNGIGTDIACMRELRRILDTICLIGLSLVGGGYTRSRDGEGLSFSCIGQFLVSTIWEDINPS